METKKCYTCQIDKNLSEFNLDKRSSDKLQGVCRECSKEYRKNHYLDNKQYYLERTKKAREKRNEEREFYKSLKSCKICGESRWWVLDFHHRDPTKKEFNIGSISSRSMHKMKKEMEKCDILCSNCHRDYHHKLKNNLL